MNGSTNQSAWLWAASRAPARPARRCDERRAVWTGEHQIAGAPVVDGPRDSRTRAKGRTSATPDSVTRSNLRRRCFRFCTPTRTPCVILAWTPKLGLEMHLPNKGLLYALATRGFKSGGFNPTSTRAGLGYAPEWAWSYEGGLKTEANDGRARLNVSAFLSDYTDLQVRRSCSRAARHLERRGGHDSRRRGRATARIGHGFEAGGHATWSTLTIPLHRGRARWRHRRCRGQPLQQCARVGRTLVDRLVWRYRRVGQDFARC